MKRFLTVLALLSCIPVAACAADKAVNAVTSAIEHSYGLKHTNLPWIARATMKPFLMGSGVGMNLALFENQALPASASMDDLQELTQKALGREWSPFVRAESQKDGERTLIYVKFEGKRMFMLIVAAERGETTVLNMKVNASSAVNMLKEKAEGRKDKQANHAEPD